MSAPERGLLAPSPSRVLDYQLHALKAAGAAVQALGVQSGWIAPVAHYDSPTGFGEEAWVDVQDQTLVAWRIAGHPVRCECRPARGQLGDRSGSQFTLQPAGEPNHYLAAGPVEFAQIYLPDGLINAAAEQMGAQRLGTALLRDDVIHVPDNVLVSEANRYLERASCLEDPPSLLEAQSRALLIAQLLISRHLLPPPPKNAGFRGGLAPWQLRRACDRMSEDLAREPGLSELAALVSLSPEHFCRAFRRSTGDPPYRWLAKRRMAQAQALLLDPNLSLTDIAQMVGYTGQSAFGAAFRRATGWRPSEWRRERR